MTDYGIVLKIGYDKSDKSWVTIAKFNREHEVTVIECEVSSGEAASITLGGSIYADEHGISPMLEAIRPNRLVKEDGSTRVLISTLLHLEGAGSSSNNGDSRSVPSADMGTILLREEVYQSCRKRGYSYVSVEMEWVESAKKWMPQFGDGHTIIPVFSFTEHSRPPFFQSVIFGPLNGIVTDLSPGSCLVWCPQLEDCVTVTTTACYAEGVWLTFLAKRTEPSSEFATITRFTSVGPETQMTRPFCKTIIEESPSGSRSFLLETVGHIAIDGTTMNKVLRVGDLGTIYTRLKVPSHQVDRPLLVRLRLQKRNDRMVLDVVNHQQMSAWKYGVAVGGEDTNTQIVVFGVDTSATIDNYVEEKYGILCAGDVVRLRHNIDYGNEFKLFEYEKVDVAEQEEHHFTVSREGDVSTIRLYTLVMYDPSSSLVRDDVSCRAYLERYGLGLRLWDIKGVTKDLPLSHDVMYRVCAKYDFASKHKDRCWQIEWIEDTSPRSNHDIRETSLARTAQQSVQSRLPSMELSTIWQATAEPSSSCSTRLEDADSYDNAADSHIYDRPYEPSIADNTEASRWSEYGENDTLPIDQPHHHHHHGPPHDYDHRSQQNHHHKFAQLRHDTTVISDDVPSGCGTGDSPSSTEYTRPRATPVLSANRMMAINRFNRCTYDKKLLSLLRHASPNQDVKKESQQKVSLLAVEIHWHTPYLVIKFWLFSTEFDDDDLNFVYYVCERSQLPPGFALGKWYTGPLQKVKVQLAKHLYILRVAHGVEITENKAIGLPDRTTASVESINSRNSLQPFEVIKLTTTLERRWIEQNNRTSGSEHLLYSPRFGFAVALDTDFLSPINENVAEEHYLCEVEPLPSVFRHGGQSAYWRVRPDPNPRRTQVVPKQMIPAASEEAWNEIQPSRSDEQFQERRHVRSKEKKAMKKIREKNMESQIGVKLSNDDIISTMKKCINCLRHSCMLFDARFMNNATADKVVDLEMKLFNCDVSKNGRVSRCARLLFAVVEREHDSAYLQKEFPSLYETVLETLRLVKSFLLVREDVSRGRLSALLDAGSPSSDSDSD